VAHGSLRAASLLLAGKKINPKDFRGCPPQATVLSGVSTTTRPEIELGATSLKLMPVISAPLIIIRCGAETASPPALSSYTPSGIPCRPKPRDLSHKALSNSPVIAVAATSSLSDLLIKVTTGLPVIDVGSM